MNLWSGALLAMLLAQAVFAAPEGPEGLTVLFTGDNGGEVAPCG